MTQRSLRFLLSDLRDGGGLLELHGFTIDPADGRSRPARVHAEGAVAARLRALVAEHRRPEDADDLRHSRLLFDLAGSWRKEPIDLHLGRPDGPRGITWVFHPVEASCSPIRLEEQMEALRRAILRAVAKALRIDPLHKCDEGHVSFKTVLPDIFSGDQRPTYAVELFAYVLGPEVAYEWTSRVSLDDAIAQALTAVARLEAELDHDEGEDEAA